MPCASRLQGEKRLFAKVFSREERRRAVPLRGPHLPLLAPLRDRVHRELAAGHAEVVRLLPDLKGLLKGLNMLKIG